MEYLIGFLLSFVVAALAAIIGLDRDRAFYPTSVVARLALKGHQSLLARSRLPAGTVFEEINYALYAPMPPALRDRQGAQFFRAAP